MDETAPSATLEPDFKPREKRPRNKVTVEQVRAIRSRLREQESVTKLAREYGLSQMQIYNIRDGVSWRDVPAWPAATVHYTDAAGNEKSERGWLLGRDDVFVRLGSTKRVVEIALKVVTRIEQETGP